MPNEPKKRTAKSKSNAPDLSDLTSGDEVEAKAGAAKASTAKPDTPSVGATETRPYEFQGKGGRYEALPGGARRLVEAPTKDA